MLELITESQINEIVEAYNSFDEEKKERTKKRIKYFLSQSFNVSKEVTESIEEQGAVSFLYDVMYINFHKQASSKLKELALKIGIPEEELTEEKLKECLFWF